jgi:predicted nucleotidyltransferase
MNLEQIKTQYSSQILDLAKQRKIENVRIFGSVARGEENKKSDVDFLIHLLPEASLLDLSGFNLDLAELLNCKVDVVSDNSIHWSIKEKILAEAVRI